MNRILVISVLILMLLQSFSKVLIMIDYQANKTYIMTYLCINQDKPQMGCEGKCQLSKKMREQDQADKKTNGQSHAQEMPLNLFCQDLFSLPALAFAAAQPRLPAYPPGAPVQACRTIFHPPQSIEV